MRGIRTTYRGQFLIERNKYAPWGRCAWKITKQQPAPYVWRKGNGRLDSKP